MSPYRLAIAGRYAERHTIKQMLAEAKLDTLPVVITASWMDCDEEGDADLTDEQAVDRVAQNMREIANAHALLYVPSWTDSRFEPGVMLPVWSPGRLIDVGLAMGFGVPIIVVGRPEPSIYFRGELVTVCEWETVRETIKRVLRIEE